MLEFHLGIPQIIWIAFMIFDIVYATVNHGSKREPYNAYSTMVASAITFALLYWGGFFN